MIRLVISLLFAIAFCTPAFFLIVAVTSFLFGIVIALFSGEFTLFVEAFKILFSATGLVLFTFTVFGFLGLWAATQLLCHIWNPSLVISPPKFVFCNLILGCCALFAFLYFNYSALPAMFAVPTLLAFPVTALLVLLNKGYLFNDH